MSLAGRTATLHVLEVGQIHGQQIIVLLKIPVAELPGSLGTQLITTGASRALGSGIGTFSDVIVAGATGVHLNQTAQPLVPDQMLKHAVGGR
jgi:hypothetical protein